MSDHLPECPAPHCDYGEPNGECYGYEDCWHRCCCPELRACEQRSYALGIEVGKHDGWVAGHAAGVQDAREAVAELFPLPDVPQPIRGETVIAAIDALRGES